MQGYLEVKTYWGTKNSSSCLPRKDFDAFANNAGIAFWATHGNPFCIVGIQVSTEEEALAWAGIANNYEEMQVVYNVDEEAYRVRVFNGYLNFHWAPAFRQNKALLFGHSCNSYTPVSACQPRTGFGYTDITYKENARKDMMVLFERMNGTEESGECRRAGDAFKKKGFSQPFDIYGDPNTTLCPSVDHPVKGNIYPLGYCEMDGKGWVKFDTHCDNELEDDASKCLEYKYLYGTALIRDVKWEGDDKITFKYHLCKGAVVKMTVKNKRVKALFGWQEIDGGYIEHTGKGIYGRAPNDDDFVWYIERE